MIVKNIVKSLKNSSVSNEESLKYANLIYEALKKVRKENPLAPSITNTVTINFKDIGSLKYSEDDVELNKEGGFRQFPIFEQFANGEVSFK